MKSLAETEFETLKNKIMGRLDVDISAVTKGSVRKNEEMGTPELKTKNGTTSAISHKKLELGKEQGHKWVEVK